MQTLDDLLRLATLPTICSGIRLPFLIFMTNGYFNNMTAESASEIEKYTNDKRTLTLLELIDDDINRVTKMAKESPSTV